MVHLVRQGFSQRAVAKRFKVAPATLRLWLGRSQGKALDDVDWADRSSAPHCVANRTVAEIEARVLTCRQQLAGPDNPLGFVGPQAIWESLTREGTRVPTPRTIARILKRHGVLDRRARRRFTPPPPGWYLPGLASGRAELDAFDLIEGLRIEDYGVIDVLTGVSLWGPYAQAWPADAAHARHIVEWLIEHWQSVGLPTYAQFDNDTRFQGCHNRPDALGRVSRLCLSLGITPVFTPPRETGFQAVVEHFNGLWQAKVWQRFHHDDLAALQAQSQRFIQAYWRHRAVRVERMTLRRPFPRGWTLNLQRPPQGRLIYIRRTDGYGAVSLLGHTFSLDACWVHRLVRCEIELDRGVIRIFHLRRRDPTDQPLLKTIVYQRPQKKFWD